MQDNYLAYKIPSFAKREAYDFDATEDSLAIYKELTAIGKKKEKCRIRNI